MTRLGDALVRRLATRAGPPRRGAPAAAPGKALVQRPAGEVAGDTWVPVVDKPSGFTYYWNQRTDETTALGELPGQLRAQQQLGGVGVGGGFGKQLVSFAAYGAGVSLSFAAVRALFGY